MRRPCLLCSLSVTERNARDSPCRKGLSGFTVLGVWSWLLGPGLVIKHQGWSSWWSKTSPLMAWKKERRESWVLRCLGFDPQHHRTRKRETQNLLRVHSAMISFLPVLWLPSSATLWTTWAVDRRRSEPRLRQPQPHSELSVSQKQNCGTSGLRFHKMPLPSSYRPGSGCIKWPWQPHVKIARTPIPESRMALRNTTSIPRGWQTILLAGNYSHLCSNGNLLRSMN